MRKKKQPVVIEFVSYSGEYPTLCTGYLTIRVDGQIRRLPEDDEPTPSVLLSGGSCKVCYNSSDYTKKGKWKLLRDYLPKDLKAYAKEIEEIVNENVEWGCCGGCLQYI